MTLIAYVARYAEQRDISQGRIEQLRIVTRLLSKFAGHEVRLVELCDTLANQWLMDRQKNVSAETVAGNRRCLLALWRSAADDNLCEPPRKVRRIRLPERAPRAFTLDELQRLLNAADSLKGKLRGTSIPKRLYWLSYIHAAYDTAVRRSDLLQIAPGDIWPQTDGSGVLVFVQSKTGHQHRARFRPSTMKLIRECVACDPKRPHIWPEWSDRRRWFRSFKVLCKRAGVQGTSKLIRRSSASYLEAVNPGTASQHLGHRSPGLDRKSYLDQSICSPSRPMPPGLLWRPDPPAA